MDNSSFPSDLISQMNLDGTNAKPEEATQEVSRLSQMVDEIDSTETTTLPCTPETEPVSTGESNDQTGGMGVAANLFRALKKKHTPTAAHGMRVALGCGVWTTARNEDEGFSNSLEIASLLHDIGKIGVPDELLAKPNALTNVERQLMAKHRLNGLEILSNCGYPAEVLEAVAYSTAWYDGSQRDFQASGSDLPIAARMLAIVDAFDSMTTEQVYRRAMSVERAMAELFQCAGTQFDPDLVASFCTTVGPNWISLRQSAGERWIAQMEAAVSTDEFWQSKTKVPTETSDTFVETKESDDDSEFFHRALVENMADGVMYIGLRQRILVWNRALERKTGITGSSVRDKRWIPDLVDLHCETGRDVIGEDSCPVRHVFDTGQQLSKRYSILGRGEKFFTADLLAIPVTNNAGKVIGVTVTIHDVSKKISLEERVESLYTRVTQDPLTKVANRSEFDRVHAEFVSKHVEDGLPCSLIICDLDFFKKINDDYGHQAGDQALVSFAQLMKRFQRIGDLAARYGGEEFVLLCADCDNATATARAEEIRQILQSTPQPVLDNKCLTSSFGVTEIQPGDTPETMLRRADRALLLAKEKGRNKVIQLGSGSIETEKREERKDFFGWFKTSANTSVSERTLITSVPIDLAIEKLKGFVSDQFAQIVSVDDNVVQLRADGHNADMMRRKSDRPVPFMISMNFSKMEAEAQQDARRSVTCKTKVDVSIEPIRTRDRRRGDLLERADQIVRSLKAYLMATDERDSERPMLARAATESGRD